MHQKNVKFVTTGFKDIGFESEEHVFNQYHHVLTRGYSLENIANLGAKNGHRCSWWVLVKMKR